MHACKKLQGKLINDCLPKPLKVLHADTVQHVNQGRESDLIFYKGGTLGSSVV